MDNEYTSKPFLYGMQRLPIESAASLMVLGDVVRGKKWNENANIRAVHQMLYDESCKIHKRYEEKETLGYMLKWIRRNLLSDEPEHLTKEYVTSEEYTNPEKYLEGFELIMRSVFSDGEQDLCEDLKKTKSKREILDGLECYIERKINSARESGGYYYPMNEWRLLHRLKTVATSAS